MKTIKGKIIQIISPKEIGNFLISLDKTKEKLLINKYLVVVDKDEPLSFWSVLKSRSERAYDIVMSHCNYKVGDTIETTIEPIMIESGLYTNEV